jgi:hypothetical protein
MQLAPLRTGVVRMTFFLMFTTLILPLFRTIVFPWVWPVAPFLGRAGTSGCQIGHMVDMAHAGCHQLVFYTATF